MAVLLCFVAFHLENNTVEYYHIMRGLLKAFFNMGGKNDACIYFLCKLIQYNWKMDLHGKNNTCQSPVTSQLMYFNHLKT